MTAQAAVLAHVCRWGTHLGWQGAGWALGPGCLGADESLKPGSASGGLLVMVSYSRHKARRVARAMVPRPERP